MSLCICVKHPIENKYIRVVNQFYYVFIRHCWVKNSNPVGFCLTMVVFPYEMMTSYLFSDNVTINRILKYYLYTKYFKKFQMY